MLILCEIFAEFYLNFKFIIMRSLCTVIVQSLFANSCDLLSKIFEVFNEIKMEINVINNEIFTKL